MRQLLLLIFGVLLCCLTVSGEEEAHRVEQELISCFTADGEIPTYEQMIKTVGHFEEPKMHHLNDKELEAYLMELVSEYPHLTQLYKIGESVNKADLRVIIVSKYASDHQKGIPEFKYVANMHGDETAGRVFLAKLAWVLLHNYGKNDYITRLVNTTRIHILPTMNPDGYESALVAGASGRYNAKGVDLNRNFPSRLKGRVPKQPIQPESQAIMAWSKAIPFVLSANLHGGTNLVNYPWDDHPSSNSSSIFNPSPDNNLFVRIAYSYARSNSRMWKKGPRCLKSGLDSAGDPQHGITNGAHWYQVANGMQDWLYVNTNSFDVTIEISCEKFPNKEVMEILWDENKYSLLEYIHQVHNAIHGEIIDSSTGKGIENVTVHLNSKKGKDVYSYGEGEFWRLANLGEHQLTFSHPNYKAATTNVIVTPKNRSPKIIVRLEKKGTKVTNEQAIPIDQLVLSVVKTKVSLKKGDSVAYVDREEGIFVQNLSTKTCTSALFVFIMAWL